MLLVRLLLGALLFYNSGGVRGLDLLVIFVRRILLLRAAPQVSSDSHWASACATLHAVLRGHVHQARLCLLLGGRMKQGFPTAGTILRLRQTRVAFLGLLGIFKLFALGYR